MIGKLPASASEGRMTAGAGLTSRRRRAAIIVVVAAICAVSRTTAHRIAGLIDGAVLGRWSGIGAAPVLDDLVPGGIVTGPGPDRGRREIIVGGHDPGRPCDCPAGGSKRVMPGGRASPHRSMMASGVGQGLDRKSTRLNSSHLVI